MSTCHTTYIVLGAEGSEVQAAATATREELARAGVRGDRPRRTVHLLFGPILHVSLSYAHIIDIGLDQADVGLHSLLVEREVGRARGAKRDEERRATRGGERSGVSVWLCTLVKCGQARKPGERSGGGGEGWSVNLSQTT